MLATKQVAETSV